MTIQGIKDRRRAVGEDGFTLIELLVVIIILGILAAVVVFAVGGIGDKGSRASCVIDTRTLRTSAEAHFARFDTYTNDPANDDNEVLNNPAPGSAPAVNENTLVSNGLLSEISILHNMEVIDVNPATGIAKGVRVLVQDIASPGADCGAAVNAPTGTCGPTFTLPPCGAGIEENV